MGEKIRYHDLDHIFPRIVSLKLLLDSKDTAAVEEIVMVEVQLQPTSVLFKTISLEETLVTWVLGRHYPGQLKRQSKLSI